MKKTVAKFCTLDTNILIYAMNADSELAKPVREKLESLKEQNYKFCITEQIVREVLCVITGSRFVTKPLDSNKAKQLGTLLLYQFVFLPSNNYSRLQFLELVAQHNIKGRKIHDANIVAIMKTHGVREIFTYNKKDFQMYDDIQLI